MLFLSGLRPLRERTTKPGFSRLSIRLYLPNGRKDRSKTEKSKIQYETSWTCRHLFWVMISSSQSMEKGLLTSKRFCRVANLSMRRHNTLSSFYSCDDFFLDVRFALEAQSKGFSPSDEENQNTIASLIEKKISDGTQMVELIVDSCGTHGSGWASKRRS